MDVPTAAELTADQYAALLAKRRGASVIGPIGRWHEAFRVVLGYAVECDEDGQVRNRWVVLARYRGEGAKTAMRHEDYLFRTHAARRGYRIRTRSFIEPDDDGRPWWVLCARLARPS